LRWGLDHGGSPEKFISEKSGAARDTGKKHEKRGQIVFFRCHDISGEFARLDMQKG
jgi:hypothetical protein